MANTTITLDDSDGYLFLTVKGTDGVPKDVQLDFVEGNHVFADICGRHKGDAPALERAWGEWLTGKGVPAVSSGAAYRIATALIDATKQFFADLGQTAPNSEPAPDAE